MKQIAPDIPLLRAPPFAGIDAAVSRPGSTSFGPTAGDTLLDAIRDARVGGRFWAPSADKVAPIIVRARTPREYRRIAKQLNGDVAMAGEVDPWSLLPGATALHAHGDDEWVALARIAGCPVTLLSDGRYGDADPSALISAARYRDPFTDEDSDPGSTVALLAHWRELLEANTGIVAACGMAWWKRREIARFLWAPGQSLRFFRSERRAIAYAARKGGAVAVWPSRITDALIRRAGDRNVPLVRVEDGFVRSVGLGANLVPPSSITVDRLGIHYDPGAPSDMERLLAEAEFPPALIARAQGLRRVILEAGISKYGRGDDHVFPDRQPGRRLVLVPGQVEDDMSVLRGGHGLASNLELLRRVRALEPEAEIWFRPHPDVDAGHRKGLVRDEDALLHADRVVRGGAMASLLDRIDAVHVLTSLTGFEALMRGIDVTCHGTPFYAGWGLTRDLAPVPDRRGRPLTLDQLVAVVLILYPRYLDPVTGLPCPPEILIRRMTDGTAHNRLGWVTRIREAQGRLMRRLS